MTAARLRISQAECAGSETGWSCGRTLIDRISENQNTNYDYYFSPSFQGSEKSRRAASLPPKPARPAYYPSDVSGFFLKLSSFSTGFRQGKSVVDQAIELSINAIQGLPKWKRQDDLVGGEHRHGRSENTRLQPGEQACNFPAVRRNEIAVGPWWPEDQPFSRRRWRS